jgi:hypothetical protein
MHTHAMDNLRYIRQTIERAGSFTAVPGWGGVAMGITALLAAALATAAPGHWLSVWLLEAGAACAIGIGAAATKARADRVDLLDGPGRKFLMGLLPPIAAGAALTAGMWRAGNLNLAPGSWMLLYGAGILAAGSSSVRPVPLMGMCFMAVGAATLFTPLAWANVFLGAGFGGLHILFGLIIAVKYGG